VRRVTMGATFRPRVWHGVTETWRLEREICAARAIYASHSCACLLRSPTFPHTALAPRAAPAEVPALKAKIDVVIVLLGREARQSATTLGQ
jgi:hypothetical protein